MTSMDRLHLGTHSAVDIRGGPVTRSTAHPSCADVASERMTGGHFEFLPRSPAISIGLTTTRTSRFPADRNRKRALQIHWCAVAFVPPVVRSQLRNHPSRCIRASGLSICLPRTGGPGHNSGMRPFNRSSRTRAPWATGCRAEMLSAVFPCRPTGASALLAPEG